MRNYRQVLISAVTFLGGLYFFLEYVLPENIGSFKFGLYHDQISTGVALVGAMAIGLGLINIFRIHGTALIRVKKGWQNSLALLGAFFCMLIAGSLDFSNSLDSTAEWKKIDNLRLFAQRIKTDAEKGVSPERRIEILRGELETFYLMAYQPADHPDSRSDGEPEEPVVVEYRRLLANVQQQVFALRDAYAAPGMFTKEELDGVYARVDAAFAQVVEAAKKIASAKYEASSSQKVAHLLYQGFFNALGTAMFSLLAFYIANAAYRSFRIRSFEALIMMLAALVVVLGQIPHHVHVHEGLPAVRRWLLLNLSTPAFRAIFFGSAIAGLAMAVRMWLSLEKSPLYSEEKE